MYIPRPRRTLMTIPKNILTQFPIKLREFRSLSRFCVFIVRLVEYIVGVRAEVVVFDPFLES